jgi:hypothetical protein
MWYSDGQVNSTAKPLYGFLLFLVVSLAARAFYIFMFSPIYSFDLSSWNRIADILMAGGNPYHLTGWLNWPPIYMELLFVFKKLSLATHLPFNLIVQGFLIAVESALALLLFASIVRFSPSANATGLLAIGIALNPVSILQVCQHCNFDVLAGFWILLAVYLLLRFQERHESGFWLLACFALGMGTVTKTVPLCLAPLLLLSVRKLKLAERFLGAVLLLGPVILAMSILYVLGPEDIQTKVFNYRAIPGCFGLHGLLAWWGGTRWCADYPRIFEIIYGSCWLCLGAWLWSRNSLDNQHIVSVSVVLLLAIPTLGPGYGPQYVYWFLPLLVLMYGLAERKVRVFLIILLGVAAATYLVEYALFFNTNGSYLLNLVQTGKLLKVALRASSPANQTLLRLPLWFFYVLSVGYLCMVIGKEMVRDVGNLWSRRSL